MKSPPPGHDILRPRPVAEIEARAKVSNFVARSETLGGGLWVQRNHRRNLQIASLKSVPDIYRTLKVPPFHELSVGKPKCLVHTRELTLFSVSLSFPEKRYMGKIVRHHA